MDTILRGSIAGLISSSIYAVVSWIIFALRILPYTPMHYNAIFITPPETPFTGPLPIALGTLALLITGMLVGVVITLITHFSGSNLAWFKGAAVGAVLWPVHSKIIPAIDPEIFKAFPLSMVFATLIFSTLWGLVTGLILRYLPSRD